MTRTAILSDIHGNLAALEAVLEDVRTQVVDEIICLGDVVGYGPRPRECLDKTMEFAFTVLGNHDSSAIFDPEGFNTTAERAIFWTREQLHTADTPALCRRRLEFICKMPRVVQRDAQLFVHGSPRGPTTEYVFPEDTQNPRKMDKLFALVTRVCFQGHTHVPGIFTSENRFIRSSDVSEHFRLFDNVAKWMVNVGSVGQPRDGDPRSCYVIWDDNTVTFRRIPYDIEQTVREIEAEPELDDMLGYRLREGR